VREVAGVEDEGGRLGRRLDFGDRRPERRRDVRVGRLVEADVAVADLREAQPAHHAAVPAAAHGLLDRRALQHAARHRPERPRPDPCHAGEKAAPPAVDFVCHKTS
jgi:hypothetical protein